MLITTYLTKKSKEYELDEKVDDNKNKRNTTTIDIESYVIGTVQCSGE